LDKHVTKRFFLGCDYITAPTRCFKKPLSLKVFNATAVPLPGFEVWGTKYIYKGTSILFVLCLKQIFLGTTKFVGEKNLGALHPITHRRGYGPVPQ